jgi:uncharacterized protein YsxB (DUF464 family)
MRRAEDAPIVVFIQDGSAELDKYETDTLCEAVTNLLASILEVRERSFL